jgi:voltage-gated potassium channel
MSGSIDARLRKVEPVLGFLNNLLLIPLLASIIIETSGNVSRLLSPELSNILFCVSFLGEWLVGLRLAADRRKYCTSVINVLELVSSIPLGLAFQGARFVRIIRLFRLMRLVVRAQRLRGKVVALARVFGIMAAITVGGAMALQAVEPQAVQTLGDALWWSLVTVSTVGYGDIYPSTMAGRLIASLLIVSGIGSFGYVAGFMSSIMEDEDAGPATQADLQGAVDRLQARLGTLEAKIDRLLSDQESSDG